MPEHGAKSILVFLPANGEAFWSLFASLVSILSGGTTTTSIRLPKLASNDLAITSASALTSPIGKDRVQGW